MCAPAVGNYLLLSCLQPQKLTCPAHLCRLPACLLLLADSCVKGSTLGACSRSDLAADLRGLSTHVAAALARHQQHAASLSSQLCSCQAAQQALQQQLATAEAQAQELRDCLGAAEASRQTAVQAAVAQTEARYSKKLIKVEARVLGMVRDAGNSSRGCMQGAQQCSAG